MAQVYPGRQPNRSQYHSRIGLSDGRTGFGLYGVDRHERRSQPSDRSCNDRSRQDGALYAIGISRRPAVSTNCTTSIPCTSTIPHQLFDPNAVLFLGTGAIPHPNSGTTLNPQNVQSPKQPTNVREDVVRADHDINDKLHLMGHWIHDQMSQTIFPVMWSGDSYDTVGNLFANPSWASVIKLTQTLSPSLLNETSLNVNGNTIAITPTASAGAAFAQPTGWSATASLAATMRQIGCPR